MAESESLTSESESESSKNELESGLEYYKSDVYHTLAHDVALVRI